MCTTIISDNRTRHIQQYTYSLTVPTMKRRIIFRNKSEAEENGAYKYIYHSARNSKPIGIIKREKMNHCVPIWDIAEEEGSRTNNNIILHSTLNSSVPISESRGGHQQQQQQMVEETVDYDVAELTWKNGQLGLHGLTSSSSSVVVPARPSPPLGGHTTHRASAGTLESIVDLAIQKHPETNHYNNEELKEHDDDDDRTPPPPFAHHKNIVFDRLVPWFDHRSVVLTREQNIVGGCGGSGSVKSSSATGSAMMDALVPSGNNSSTSSIIRRQDQKSNTKISRRSNRGAADADAGGGRGRGDDNGDRRLMIRGDNDKHRAAAAVAAPASWRGTSVTGNGRNIIVRGKTTREDGGDSCAQVRPRNEKKGDCMHVNHESTVEKTIASSAQSIGSGGTGKQQMVYSNRKSYYSNTMATTSLDDSSCHSRPIPHPLEEEGKNGGTKSSGSTKRSRAAAVHNQSERKRREKINERIKTLQKLVPNSSKIDKASMLDEVIEYLKQLQAQVNMMSKLNVPSMMMSMAFMQQQQQQMSMMAAMGMFNMGMDINMNMNMNPLLMAAHHNPLISTTTTTTIPGTGMTPATNSGAAATASFVPMTMTAPWDGLQGNRLQAGQTSMPPMMSNTQAQPLSTMEMDAYNRMVASSYQQMRQQQHSASTS